MSKEMPSEVDDLRMANIAIVEKRLFRLNQLSSYIGEAKDLSDSKVSDDLAGRIISNMSMTIEQQEKCWKVPLKSLLRRPLPYDAADPFKPSLYLEMMPSVGNNILHQKIWDQLDRAFNAGPQSGKFLALLVGVSGMGKTKTAYDIGKESAFGIITRIVERDTLTPPWQTFIKILDNVLILAIPDVAEKCSLVACVILLMIAHLQFALDVTCSAKANINFEELVTVRMLELQCNKTDATELILKEVVLRCQRNGLAYAQVNARFQKLLLQTIQHPDFITAEGVLAIQLSFVTDILLSEVTRSKQIWGEGSRIVWFYDEIQATLNMIRSDSNVFSGVFQHIVGRQVVPLNQISQASAQSGLFYGILIAIRKMLEVVSQGHVLLGSNLLLTPEVCAQNSPAQGCCETYEEAFHINEENIVKLLGVYLSDAALDSVNRTVIRALSGRPLFVSHFWTCLLQCAAKLNTENIALGDVVYNALILAYESAVVDAKYRINRMWSDYSPNVQPATPSGGLMALLYHSIVMNSGGGGLQPLQMELKEAILRGILNCTGKEDKICLDNEPVTKKAFMAVGHDRLLLNTDGIMELLASRVTMPMGSEKCDFGEVLEACFPWYLVRQCIIAGGAISLRSLFAPFLATHPSCDQVTEQLEDYEVQIDFGRRWNSVATDRSPLATLKRHPSCLIHHPDDTMAGPDAMHIVKHRHEEQKTIPVFYQLKNRQTGTIFEAMRSLNLGSMHPDRKGGVESSAHHSMREVLEQDNNWLEPFRVLVASRNFEPAVLHHVAWFNQHQWERSPLILLTINKRNLGIDITPNTITSYGPPRDWASLWPSDIRHSNLQSPVSTIQSNLCRVSLSVKITWNLISLQKITKQMIMTKIYLLTDNASVTSVAKSRGFPSMIISFARITDAFKIVEIQHFNIGNRKFSCEFI